MDHTTPAPAILPAASRDVLSEVLRAGAKRMLTEAIEAEIDEWVAARAHLKDETGRQQVVRNGYLPERTIVTGIGEIEVRQPRARDRRPGEEREQFHSTLLPPYLRRTKSVDELIPWLYLKGISSGDMPEALQALLGPECGNLSANTVVRLKQVWEAEYETWSKRSLDGQEFVYVWADGIYVNVRLGEGERQCLLVVMGATRDGKKHLLAVHDGVRESEQSWSELLLDLKRRGLAIAPKLAIGDGALGFWAAVAKVWPQTQEQRCWVHKTANVLNALPKSKQAHAKQSSFAMIVRSVKRWQNRQTPSNALHQSKFSTYFRDARPAALPVDRSACGQNQGGTQSMFPLAAGS